MEKKPLRFKNGKFKILLIGDLHEKYDVLSEGAADKASDMHNLLSKAAEELKPDLAVYLGDNAAADDIMQMRTVISRIVYPFSSKDIPFAVVFGNHDRETGVDLPTQLKLFNEFYSCYAYNADDNITGCGNYNLLVKASDSDEDILNLWFMDSNSRYPDENISYYDIVHEDQIEWYRKRAREIAAEHGGKTVPALAFQHIPVIEEYELLREARAIETLDDVKGHGIHSNKNYVLREGVEGYLGEGPATPDINDGQFAAWKEIGDVKGAFFGHDHLNDFSGYVDGILLAQNKTAGFRPYTDGCRSGVRLVTLDENDVENFTTKMYHFKEFGLRSKSLNPIEQKLTDRQSTKLKVAGAVVGTAAAVTVAVAVAKTEKKNNK